MLFEKNGETIDVSLYQGTADFPGVGKVKIAGIEKHKTTMQKISYLESIGYHHLVIDVS